MKTKECTKTKLQKKAEELSKYFYTEERNGYGKYFLKANRPDELFSLVQKAHGDMFPDDWKYEFISTALDVLSQVENPDDVTIEADVYNHDLLRWLSSNLTRAEYVNEVAEEYEIKGKGFDLYVLIGWGQIREKEEVLGIVLDELRKIVGEE